MQFPIYYVLLSVQTALENAITPQLRAVTVDLDEKKRELLVCFFYHGEITEELRTLSSVVMAEVDVNAKEHYSMYENSVQVDFPKKIPIQGRLVFLRNEPNLPQIEKENRNFLLKEWPPIAVFRLNMQEALLGRISPSLRLVSVGINEDQKQLISHFIYDGEISEEDMNMASSAINEASSFFPQYKINSSIERIDFPNQMLPRGTWAVYLRQEWKY